jgi:7-cyano-7-deazaguanine synthase
MQKRAIVLLSGGLDSATAAAIVKHDGWALYALTVRYGQVHAREIEAARDVARGLGVERHVELDVDLRAFGGSSLLGDGDIPKRSASGLGLEAREPGRDLVAGRQPPAVSRQPIPSTYVPARNTIFLSLALGWAEVVGAQTIVVGVNAIDYSGYPDCRPEYLAAFEYLATLATRTGVEGGVITIRAPLLHLTKAGIIRAGTALGVDYGLTHSCYDPLANGRPCECCDSCRIRAQGFAEAGLPDPLLRGRES